MPVSIPLGPAKERAHLQGLAYAVLGATFWGLSGTAAQALFQGQHISPQWLVTVRMLGSGVLMYLWLRPPLPRQRLVLLVLFAVLGLAGVQYTYFGAIAYSNVTTATCLQYLSLPLVTLYQVLFSRKKLARSQVVALAMALSGSLLLVLGGQDGVLALSVSTLGLVLGLLAAATAAFYTIASVPLLSEYGTRSTTTWGFLIGGTAMGIVSPPWQLQLPYDLAPFFLLTGFVVLVGTLLAFSLVFASLARITPLEASISFTMEPVSAALAAYLFLQVTLSYVQYLGGLLILLAVVLLSRRGREAGELGRP